jgi:hypothetical protein
MSELKENAKNFFGAGKELGKSLLKEGQKVFDKHVKPAVENVSDDVKRQKVLKKINEEKDASVKQDKTKRKYHKGG